MTTRRRRPPGEGGVFEYRTRARPDVARFGITFDLPSDGRRRQVIRKVDAAGRPWLAYEDAVNALREALVKSGRGEWAEPSRQPLSTYLADWLDGLRLAPSTVASYRKNMRLHVVPYLGAVPLGSLTSAKIAALYRQLETSGRADHRQGEALSARTCATSPRSCAPRSARPPPAGMLSRNPADPKRAKPPTAKEATAPEMHPWNAAELAAFLSWSRENSQLHAAWHVLAMTGMRRGELLALRWRDIDLDAATVSVRRSAGVVRVKGEGATITEGPTKTGRPRVLDLDEDTVTLLRAHRPRARRDGAVLWPR